MDGRYAIYAFYAGKLQCAPLLLAILIMKTVYGVVRASQSQCKYNLLANRTEEDYFGVKTSLEFG